MTSQSSGDRTPHDPEAPDYDVEIEADELLADLAADAAEYGEDYEEKRGWWHDSFDDERQWLDAKNWMLEARGGQRAYSESLGHLQPGGRFRNDGGTVDVRGFLRWLSRAADDSHERAHEVGSHNPQANEAESAYVKILSTVREDYGVGWPRLDDISGNPIQVDLP